MTNRRREERRRVKLPIEVRISSGTTYRGFSRDLSPRGMGALIAAPLEMGEAVWIKYEHPAPGEERAEPLVRRAMVRQRNGYRYGFEFELPLDF